ncbi:hypothetical protein ES708_34546 [subsurface metagenome]
MQKTKKRTKINMSSPQKTNKKELSKLESEALDKRKKRNEERISPPKFERIKGGKIVPKEKDFSKLSLQMMETTGSSDMDFSSNILSQAIRTLLMGDDKEKTDFVAAFMYGLKPKDEMEGVLITQMVGTHNLIMSYMGRAILPNQTTEAINDNTNRAYKLMNIFLKQVEALSKYRGKTVEQKVIVEHVHVYGGGRAIVGNVEGRQTGGGDKDRR